MAIRFIGAALIVLAITAQARADLITFEFTGEVIDAAGAPFGAAASIGDPATGTFTLDTSVVDDNPSSGAGEYPNVGTITLEVGGAAITGSNAEALVADLNPMIGGDGFLLASSVLPAPGGDLAIGLGDTDGAFLTSDALPTSFPVSQLELAQVELEEDGDGGIAARITQIERAASTTPVPEPASLAIWCVGAVAVGLALYRKRDGFAPRL